MTIFDEHKKYFVGIILIALSALSALLIALSLNALKQNKFIGRDFALRNSITVSGEGEVLAIPDTAQFTVSVTEEALVVAAAQANTTEKIDTVLTLLAENDVDEKDVKTVNYSISPRYEFRRSNKPSSTGGFPPSERVLVGYTVTQTLSVKVRDIENAGTLLGGMGEIGVTNVSGLNFIIDDEDELRAEAREQAIGEAKDKAKKLSRELGVSLSRIIGYSESGPQPVFARLELTEDAFGIGGGAPAPSIPTGENSITSFVSITYEIR